MDEILGMMEWLRLHCVYVYPVKNLGNSKFKGKLTGTSLVIQEQNGTIVSLDQFESNFYGNIPEDTIQIALKGRTGVAQEESKGFFDLDLDINDLFFANEFSLSHACYSGNLSLEKFPSLLLSPILKDYPLLGHEFNAHIEGNFLCNQDPTGQMNFHFESDTLNIATRFKMDNKAIQLTANPLENNLISFNLTPVDAKKLFPNNFNLKAPISAKISLDHLSFPNIFLSVPDKLEFLNQLEGQGNIQISSIAIDDYNLNNSNEL